MVEIDGIEFEEIYKGHRGSQLLREFEVRFRRKGITFSRGFSKILEGQKHIQVFQNKQRNLIAFKPTKDSSIGFAINSNLKNDSFHTTLPSRWMVPKDTIGDVDGSIKKGTIFVDITNIRKRKSWTEHKK